VKNALLSSTTAAGKPIEIWFQDEARVGQKGTHAYVWAPVGSCPLMVKDNRHDSVHLFGAICPARDIGAVMLPALHDLAARHPAIGEVRGRGAMIAVEIVKPGTTEPDAATTAAVSKACHEAGLLTLTCGTYGNVLRFLPPLVMPVDTLRRGLAILADAFASVCG
jgi:hypothetical protein